MHQKKIMIIDQYPIVLKGLHDLICSENYLCVYFQFASEDLLRQALADEQPDLLIIDELAQPHSLVELVKKLKSLFPDLNIIIFSINSDVAFVDHLLRAGISGYLLKIDSLSEIMNGIRQVLCNEIFVSDKIRMQLVKRLVAMPPKSDNSPEEILSTREIEVFKFIGQGLSTKRIAELLKLGIKTVESHRLQIKKKLGLKDNTQLIQQAVRWLNNMDS